MKAKLSGQTGIRNPKANTNEITFNVERHELVNCLVGRAAWSGGITTQGKDLRELEPNVREAVRCHFDEKIYGDAPGTIRRRDVRLQHG